jgi:hypothetical protein
MKGKYGALLLFDNICGQNDALGMLSRQDHRLTLTFHSRDLLDRRKDFSPDISTYRTGVNTIYMEVGRAS